MTSLVNYVEILTPLWALSLFLRKLWSIITSTKTLFSGFSSIALPIKSLKSSSSICCKIFYFSPFLIIQQIYFRVLGIGMFAEIISIMERPKQNMSYLSFIGSLLRSSQYPISAYSVLNTLNTNKCSTFEIRGNHLRAKISNFQVSSVWIDIVGLARKHTVDEMHRMEILNPFEDHSTPLLDHV